MEGHNTVSYRSPRDTPALSMKVLVKSEIEAVGLLLLECSRQCGKEAKEHSSMCLRGRRILEVWVQNKDVSCCRRSCCNQTAPFDKRDIFSSLLKEKLSSVCAWKNMMQHVASAVTGPLCTPLRSPRNKLSIVPKPLDLKKVLHLLCLFLHSLTLGLVRNRSMLLRW